MGEETLSHTTEEAIALIGFGKDLVTNDQRDSKSVKGRSKVLWTLVGAAIGFFLGGSIGIAALGTGFNGGFIFAIIGGVIGYLLAGQAPKA